MTTLDKNVILFNGACLYAIPAMNVPTVILEVEGQRGNRPDSIRKVQIALRPKDFKRLRDEIFSFDIESV